MSEEELAVKRLLKLGAALLDKGYESLANACTESARVITDLERENADLRAKLAEAERKLAEALEWAAAAKRLGESLSSTGPKGYYDFTPQQWLSWALGIAKDAEHRGADAAR